MPLILPKERKESFDKSFFFFFWMILLGYLPPCSIHCTVPSILGRTQAPDTCNNPELCHPGFIPAPTNWCDLGVTSLLGKGHLSLELTGAGTGQELLRPWGILGGTSPARE